jgi:hypothetical protein
VHCYVKLHEHLARELKGTAEGFMTDDWYLHCAAGIALHSAALFYERTLIPALMDEKTIPPEARENVWLSSLLCRVSSPLVRIWKDGARLMSDSGTSVHSVYDCVFGENRQSDVYFHIGYPCRGTALTEHVGPAGCYLLVDPGEAQAATCELPPCLVSHLRTFVQVMVTAQIRALSEHLIDDLRRAAEPFVVHAKHFHMFYSTAAELAERIDFLRLDTSALSALKHAAAPVFHARKPSGGRPTIATVVSCVWRIALKQAKPHGSGNSSTVLAQAYPVGTRSTRR